MAVDRLLRFLRQHRRIALDTSVFIYQLEANERYLPVVDPIFASLDHLSLAAVTSAIAMLELLVHPYREAEQQHADELYALLSKYPHLEWIPLDLPIASLAAQLRAQHNLKTPDAIQAATAAYAGATAFITNDLSFRRLRIIDVLLLDDLL